MPFLNTRYKFYLEITCYILLLFFFVPIKINNYSTKYEFEQYLKLFNKTYPNKTVYNLRLTAFESSLNTIKLLNQNRTNTSAQYGLTKFSDLLPDEFLSNHLQGYTYKGNVSQNDIIKRAIITLPKKVDWRLKNVITKVRSQYNCGACWAFSAIETIEAMYAIKTGKLEDFSVQQMIDCSSNNFGCNGGDTCSLLRWLKIKNVKIVKDSEYPLTFETDACKNVTDIQSDVYVNDFTCNSFLTSEDKILALLAKNGPVVVAINAKTWQHYIGGVIQFHCESDSLNHAVQIVGYDLTASVPHYIVRNSWGPDFGDDGYLYIAIGGNLCGLAYEVSAINIL